MLKRILGVCVLAMFSFALVGCEASGKVGDPNGTNTTTTNGGSYEKKTTTVTTPSGDTHTRTDVRTSNP